MVDDTVWFELAQTDELPVTWVVLEQILPPDPNRLRYADDTGTVVFVLDWSDDAETFQGYIRITIDGSEDYVTVAGRRSVDEPDIYDVNLANEGETDFVTGPWEVFPGGLATGDTPYDVTGCARSTTAEQAAAEARFDRAEFPPFPETG